MPKGPQGQKRSADIIGAAIKIAKIATGEIEEKRDEAKAYMQKGGKKGGKARAKKLSAKRRHEIAKLAAAARWKKSKG